jgi:hypothetical protein
MRRNRFVFITVVVAIVLATAFAAFAQSKEKKVKLKDLPAAVQKTVGEQSRGAKIRGLAEEVSDGKTVYEVELTVNGHSKDVLIDPSGAVVEVEEEVAFGGLPAAAKSEIVRQAGKGRILLVESITKGDVVVAYEAHVKTAGKISEIKVGVDGKPIAQ